MAENEVISNQEFILGNQATIRTNQDRILENRPGSAAGPIEALSSQREVPAMNRKKILSK